MKIKTNLNLPYESLSSFLRCDQGWERSEDLTPAVPTLKGA